MITKKKEMIPMTPLKIVKAKRTMKMKQPGKQVTFSRLSNINTLLRAPHVWHRTLLSDLLGGSKEDAEKQVEEEKKRRRLVALVTGSTDDTAERERTETTHMSSASEYSSRGMLDQ